MGIWTEKHNRERLLKKLAEENFVYDQEYVHRAKDGHQVIARYSGELVELGGETCILGVLVDITERKRTEEALSRQLTHLRALNTINQTIIGSLDLKRTLDVFLRQVTEELHVDAADVLLFNPHIHMLEFKASIGFRNDDIKQTRERFGEGYAGRAALERQIIHIVNLEGGGEEFVRTALIGREGFIAYFGIPLIAKGQLLGVLEIFHRDILVTDSEWMDLLEALANQAAISIDNAKLFDELQRTNVELEMAYDTTLEGWSAALDLRDRETEGHTQRVTDMTIRLARLAGFNDEEIIHVRRGALLHDIGKMGIPDAILLKPDRLTSEELVIMRKHPIYAYELLYPIKYLRPAIDIPYCHHEKWDGTGYPRALKGEQIPLAARIFAVVDVWDALISERHYRAAIPKEKVIEMVRSESGKHFDPQIVKAFMKFIKGKYFIFHSQ